MGVSPYSCCAEAKTRWDPQGFTSLTIVILITCHIHIGLEQEPEVFTLENHNRSLLCKVYGDKSDDSGSLFWSRDAFVPPLQICVSYVCIGGHFFSCHPYSYRLLSYSMINSVAYPGFEGGGAKAVKLRCAHKCTKIFRNHAH